jgi:hypothetical protein
MREVSDVTASAYDNGVKEPDIGFNPEAVDLLPGDLEPGMVAEED